MSISTIPVRRLGRARLDAIETRRDAGFATILNGESTMKVMVIIKSDENSEAGIMPDEKILSEMGAYNEQLVNAGIMKAGEGLHPSSRGKRVRFTGAQRSVIDGPFTEAKE